MNLCIPAFILAAAASAAVAQAQTINAYHIGNSLTDGFVFHANYENFVQTHQPGVDYRFDAQIIFGAPLDWIWDNGQPHSDSTTGDASKATMNQFGSNYNRFWTVLPNVQLDHLTLQVFDRNAGYDFHYASGRIKTQVTMFTKWPEQKPAQQATYTENGTTYTARLYSSYSYSSWWVNGDMTAGSPGATDPRWP